MPIKKDKTIENNLGPKNFKMDSNVRILNFCSDDVVRKKRSKILSQLGNTKEAASYRAANSLYLVTDPDIIVTDFSLRGRHGLDFLKKIESIEQSRPNPTKFIFISDTNLDDLVYNHKNIADCLCEPIDDSYLLKSVYQIAETVKLEKKLMNFQIKHDQLFNNIQGVYFEVNLDGEILNVSPSIEDNSQYKPDDLIGKNVLDLYSNKKQREELMKILHKDGTVKDYDLDFKDKDGKIIPCSYSASIIYNKEEIEPIICGELIDISKRKKLEEKLKNIIKIDDLTGLPNRRGFISKLPKYIKESTRHDDLLAVLFIDLDQFKKVNDSYNHTFGDKLLKQVAGRLTDTLRDTDFVWRHGGDEFGAILSPIKHPHDSAVVASKVLNSISQDYSIGGKTIDYLSGSIGISSFDPLDYSKNKVKVGDLAEKLIHEADTAMYVAKEDKNTFIHYSRKMEKS